METTTPEFIRWSLRHECGPRLACRGDEPEQVERQLKSLRAYSDAMTVGRELDGLCFESELDSPPGPQRPPQGFRGADVLQACGVRAPESLPCVGCPAHVDHEPGASPWAGCFGLVDWNSVAERLPQVVPFLLDQVASREQVRRDFLPTNPPWPGLWAHSPLTPPQLPVVEGLLERLVAQGDVWAAVFERFLRAVRAAREFGLLLDVSYSPAGRLSGRHWLVAAHCSRCKSSRAHASRACPVCGLDARPVQARRRLARGTRPFRPLGDFLGDPARRDLLRRYLVTRKWNSTQIEHYLRDGDAAPEGGDSADRQPCET